MVNAPGVLNSKFRYKLCHNQTVGFGRAQLDPLSRTLCRILGTVEYVSLVASLDIEQTGSVRKA